MRVGWIGLGAIGTPMAQRVLGAGHRLVAYARGAGQEAIARQGGELSADYRAIAAGCEVLGVCLFNDAQVRATLLDGGALAAMPRGAVLALHTTGSPALARKLGDLAPLGVQVIDACFSGGPQEVREGRLTIMVGGDAAAVARAQPVLSSFGSPISHVGPLGAGQTLKLLNNLLFAANLKHAAEVIGLAKEQGLDPLLAAKIIQSASGASMAMSRFVHAQPEQMMPAVWPYLAKDVSTVAASAHDAGLNLASFDAVIAHFTQATGSE
nr:NAD(P)-dependent oxidoreductase [Novosphingobium chloroacetimidivorans]